MGEGRLDVGLVCCKSYAQCWGRGADGGVESSFLFSYARKKKKIGFQK